MKPSNRNIYIQVLIYHSQVIDESYPLCAMKMKPNNYFKPTKYIVLTDDTGMSIDCGKAPSCSRNLFYGNKLASHILDKIYHRSSENCLDPTDEIFKDRLDLMRSKLELILLQLNQRKVINQKILYQIDKDSCKVQTLNLEMGPKAYEMGRERLTLEQMQFDLKQQKRMEETSYFKDTGLLNTQLKDTLIEYMEEKQKSALLTGEDVI
jgi:hypothetical protein